MPSGGYRKPAHPAPVSGPGELSQRTDGGPGDSQPIRSLPGAAYGESGAFQTQQAGAPVPNGAPAAPAQGLAGPPSVSGTAAGLTPLDAPTTRPDEPITHGIDLGAGGGSEVMGDPMQMQAGGYGSLADTLSTLSSQDNTGVLAQLYLDMGRRGVIQ